MPSTLIKRVFAQDDVAQGSKAEPMKPMTSPKRKEPPSVADRLMPNATPLAWSVKSSTELAADNSGYAKFHNVMGMNVFGNLGWKYGEQQGGKRASIVQTRWAITQKPLKVKQPAHGALYTIAKEGGLRKQVDTFLTGPVRKKKGDTWVPPTNKKKTDREAANALLNRVLALRVGMEESVREIQAEHAAASQPQAPPPFPLHTHHCFCPPPSPITHNLRL